MFSWNTFPYSDFNKVNLDWICRQISACGTFWTSSVATAVTDPDRGTGISFYMADMTGPAGDAEPKQGDAVFYSLDSITYCAFIDDVIGAGGGNPEFFSWRIYRMTGPQGEPGSGGGTGLTEEIKQALLQLAQKVAYIDANGADYYQDLYDALYDVEPPATLVSIDAVYTQSGTVYDTDPLDSLKTDLVVTATYFDSSTAVIPAADYTLSGSLTVGTSTITVSYGGQTDTFTVTVTENPPPPVTLVSIDAVYTQSGTVYDTDTLDSLKTDLVVTATYSDSSTAVIPAADYTLSGTLTAGSSVITVTYSGQTDTFTVTVTASPITLVSIDAVYTQSETVYDTDTLDSLKADLVVTATYSDSSTAAIPAADYTLSGTLTAGSSIITVSYGGQTDTFTVTVTHAILWTFSDGYSISKGATGQQAGKIWRASASARACGAAPIANDGYVFTVTDSSKYQIAAYDVTDDTPIETTHAPAIDGVWYQGGSKSISWKTEDSVTTPYVWLALKKQDNTGFTAEELANGAAAVFTYTKSV